MKIVVIANEMFAEGKHLPSVSKTNTRMAGGHFIFERQTKR